MFGENNWEKAKRYSTRSVTRKTVIVEELVKIASRDFLESGTAYTAETLKSRYALNKKESKRLFELLNNRKYILEVAGKFNKEVEQNARIAEQPSIQQINETRLLKLRAARDNELVVRGEQSKILDGFIYLLINPVWPDWVKAGMTIDYEDRLKTYLTGDPFNAYEFKRVLYVDDRRSAERKLLETLTVISEETRGEWFRIELEKAILAFDGSPN